MISCSSNLNLSVLHHELKALTELCISGYSVKTDLAMGTRRRVLEYCAKCSLKRNNNNTTHNESAKLSASCSAFCKPCDTSNSFNSTQLSNLDPSENIVQFFDSYPDPLTDTHCIVMEYMGGGSMKDVVNKKVPLTEEEISIVAFSVLKALERLASQQYIHRDVKVLC